ncbi:hypothetical protein CDL15_Pgr002991 [Punica granatum]|uniref:Protein kinase domain-containing protein n=1 Tax=Punica granatum TaxID=22663 RepID=A0A218X2D4_PUNGR|nr:hypothetical protein CDL15_Pgr002991 [Punica granatum]
MDGQDFTIGIQRLRFSQLPYVSECEALGQNSCNQQSEKCVNVPGGFHCVGLNGKNTSIITGLPFSLGSLVLIFLAWRMYILMKKRRESKLKEKFFKRIGGLILQRQLSSPDRNVSKLFNSKELAMATDHFSKDRILGKGGQGTVYKRMLADGMIVAVKKSISIDEKNVEPFINEVVILSQINHRNIVKLLGCCLESALDQTHAITLVQGTFGYLDPEYFQTGHFTEKSDAYSFGIVLVELLTGQKPTTSLLGDNCIGLASSFITAMEEDRLFEILDPRVRKEGGEEEIIVVANLAKRCLNLKDRERTSMKDLVIELEGIRKRSQLSSSLAQHQEEVDHADPNEFEADDDLSISGGSEADLGSIRLSDGRALLTSVTW